MKKAECIEKYGIEVWEKYLNQAREWRKTHKQHMREYRQNWTENNLEKVIGYKDKYYNKNKEEIIDKNKKSYQTYLGNARKKWSKYNCQDKDKRGFDISNNITPEWIIENIFTSKCIYCGDSDWRHLGCDRIDNSKPHTPENCVPCCFICNIERGDKFSVEEFKEYRSLHPRACDIPKATEIQLSETGAIKKRTIKR